MNTNITSLYDFVLQQMAAESYFEDPQSWANTSEVQRLLRLGTNREGFQTGSPELNGGYSGLTRMTSAQAEEFVSKFTIIHQWSDNPTILDGEQAPRPTNPGDPGYLALNGQQILANTGLSATLIRSEETGEYTLSIRSTEYRNWAEGGDGQRDAMGADVNDIVKYGYSFAQLDALEQYYQWLKVNTLLPTDAKLNVTGYSLGGHLATVFTEIHQSEMNGGQTVTFNGAGRGTLSGGTPQEMMVFYRQVLLNPGDAPEGLTAEASQLRSEAMARAGQPFDPLSIYADPRYQWASLATSTKYNTFFGGFADELRTGTSADGIITQVWGQEFNNNLNMTANSGIHGPALGVFIESQPALEGWPSTANFGNGHSIVLIADSMALMRSFQKLDPSITVESLNTYFSQASNLSSQSVITGAGQNSAYEYDALENALDGLRRIFLGSGVLPTPYKASGSGFADLEKRQAFYENLAALEGNSYYSASKGKVTFAPVPSDGLQARDDFAALLSLVYLTPFSLILPDAGALDALKSAQPTLAAQWQADKALTTEERAYGKANFSDQYLASRADFLMRKLYYNDRNASYDGTDPTAFGSNAATKYDAEDIVWVDRQSGIKIQRGAITASTRYIVFGSDQNEADFLGGNREDHLYGGGGNDIVKGLDGDDYLEGNAGEDTLEGGVGYDVLVGGTDDDTLVGGEGHDLLLGGAGEDTYYFEGNVGLDIIRDSDGNGKIVVGPPGFESLSGGNKLADNAWISDDKRFIYTLVEGNLVIRPAAGSGASGILTVKDWTNGQLGITLSDTAAPLPATTTSYIGDFAKKTNPEGTQYVLGEDGQYVADGAQANALDLITGTGEADLIQGMGGDDALLGAGGDDIIEGGEGNDVLMGGLGADVLKGGADRDLIYGSSTGSLQYPLTNYPVLEASYPIVLGEGFNWTYTSPGLDDDGFQQGFLSNNVGRDTQPNDAGNTIDGGSGDDVIYAGTGNDVVHGGQDMDQITGMAGADMLFGDEGDDRIYGDGSATNTGVLTYTPADQHGADILVGGTGDDLLIGQGGGDALYGGVGSDWLYGDDRDDASLSGDDYLDGGDDNDVLLGGAGDDILIGGSGNDTLKGGAGRDVYVFNRGDGQDTVFDDGEKNNVFRFGAGVNRSDVTLRLGSLMLDLGNGDQIHIEGFNQADALNSVSISSFEFADGSTLNTDELLSLGFDIDGTEGDDILQGTSVDDRIHGLGGNDLLLALSGNNLLDGGDGDDSLVAGDGEDTLIGGGGRNTYFLHDHGTRTVVQASGDEDLVVLAAGVKLIDVIGGNADAEGLTFTLINGQQLIVQGQASYQFTEGTYSQAQVTAFIDSLAGATDTGTDGNDILHGQATDDYLFAGDGDDVVVGAAGDDRLFGQSGHDTVAGGLGADSIAGGGGNDALYGDAGSDKLWGQAGDDSLYGGTGADELTGGDGNDVFAGGTGDDLLIAGGSGAKIYLFELGNGRDIVLPGTGTGRVKFGAGIVPADIKLYASPVIDPASTKLNQAA